MENNAAKNSLRILLITSEWPTPEHPEQAPFVVQQVDYLRRLGMQVDVFPFSSAGNPLNYLRAWSRAQKKLRRKKYDVVHAHFGHSGMLAVPKRAPLIVTFHGSDLEGIIGPNGEYTRHGQIFRQVSRVSARFADECIVVSKTLARHLPDGVPYNVIPGGVNLELFKPADKAEARAQLGLPQDRTLVLFGGRTNIPRKRYALSQEAVELLRGEYDADLIDVNYKPHDVMPVYMAACDVLVLTSIHEGSPTVVKEALACNLPVVTVNVGDVIERIGEVPGCVVCADDKAETIAAGLREVLSRKVPFEGRAVAERELDEAMLIDKVVGLYRGALHKRSSRK